MVIIFITTTIIIISPLGIHIITWILFKLRITSVTDNTIRERAIYSSLLVITLLCVLILIYLLLILSEEFIVEWRNRLFIAEKL